MTHSQDNNPENKKNNPFSDILDVETDTEITVEIEEIDENDENSEPKEAKKDEKETKLSPERQKKLDLINNFDHDHETAKARRRLLRTFSDLEGYKKSIAKSLIGELAALEAQMMKMRMSYEFYGEVENFKQGNDVNLRISPYVQIYDKSLSRYAALFKQIRDLYPKDDDNTKIKVEVDPLADFMNAFESR